MSGGRTVVTPPSSAPIGIETVRVEDGIQFIRVVARGGYTPSDISARAGIPTKLEIETKGTYDCSAAFTIPSMQLRKMLPPTGITVIDLPKEPAGTSLLALCAMGMYSLQIQFN
jgi:plastocyanin domain-containing protein